MKIIENTINSEGRGQIKIEMLDEDVETLLLTLNYADLTEWFEEYVEDQVEIVLPEGIYTWEVDSFENKILTIHPSEVSILNSDDDD